MDTNSETMPLTFHCEQCGLDLEVPAKLSGRRARCPRCGDVSRVPSVDNDPVVDLPGDGRLVTPKPSAEPRPQRSSPHAEENRSAGGGSYVPVARSVAPANGPAAEPQHRPHTQEPKLAQVGPAPGADRRLSARPTEKPAQLMPRSAAVAPKPAQKPLQSYPALATPNRSTDAEHSAAHVPGLPPAEPMARCPYCRERIQIGARKCKHCFEFLDESLRASRTRPQRTPQWSRASARFGGFTPELLSRPKLLITAGIVVVAAVGISLGAYFLLRGGHDGSVAGASGRAPSKAELASVNEPKLESLAAGLEKQLTGTPLRDPVGNTVTFPASAKAVVPWSCEVQKTGNPRNPIKGVITVPYQLDSRDARIASNKGRYMLEFNPHGTQWELEQILKETRVVIRGASVSDVPEEDRAAVKQNDRDFVVQFLKQALAKSQGTKPPAPAPADD